jgi:hypothetical protein
LGSKNRKGEAERTPTCPDFSRLIVAPGVPFHQELRIQFMNAISRTDRGITPSPGIAGYAEKNAVWLESWHSFRSSLGTPQAFLFLLSMAMHSLSSSSLVGWLSLTGRGR